MIIYESKFAKVEYFATESLTVSTWFLTTKNMRTSEYKKEFMNINELHKKHAPSLLLSNTSNFLFTIDPDVQEWLNKEITTTIAEIKLKKLAIVLSKDLFSQVSINQLLEEEAENKVSTKYFGSIEYAKEWLLENDEVSN